MLISSKSIVMVADTIRAGVPFAVTVNTFGNDSCWGLERTKVVNTESGAIIAPYNRNYGEPNTMCLATIQGIAHSTMLTFATAGEKTLRVRAHDFETGAPRQLDFTIVVRP